MPIIIISRWLLERSYVLVTIRLTPLPLQCKGRLQGIYMFHLSHFAFSLGLVIPPRRPSCTNSRIEHCWRVLPVTICKCSRVYLYHILILWQIIFLWNPNNINELIILRPRRKINTKNTNSWNQTNFLRWFFNRRFNLLPHESPFSIVRVGY